MAKHISRTLIWPCLNTSLCFQSKQIVSTHHEAECNEEKKCPKNKYCRNFHCFEAHRKHHECDEDDECADDMPCIYGRCDDKPKGSPGKDHPQTSCKSVFDDVV